MNWKEEAAKDAKSLSRWGIAAAIVMVVFGFVMLFNPAAMLRTLVWVLVLGMIVGGAFRLYAYYKTPAWLRSGYNMVIGVLDLLCGALLLASAVQAPVITDEMFALFIGYMFGFATIISGIDTLAGTSMVRRLGAGSGWLVAGGVLELIAGVLLVMAPSIGTFFLMFALAFALIVGGLNLFAASIDMRNRIDAFSQYADTIEGGFDPESSPFYFHWNK